MDVSYRSLMASDAEDIYRIRSSEGVYQTTLSLPYINYELTVERFRKAASDPNSYQIVACVRGADGRETAIGIAGIRISDNPRLRHRGEVAIMVRTDYQGKGIGKELMRRVVGLSDNYLMLTRLDLTYMEGNDNAGKLYRSFGFEEEGRIRKAVSLNGEYKDEIIMGRLRPMR